MKWIVVGLHAVALDVLQTLVRYSEPPLSDTLMNTAFPAALQCILRTDDNSTMQVYVVQGWKFFINIPVFYTTYFTHT
jgi:hypothetical protein